MQPFAKWCMCIKEVPWAPIADIDRNLPASGEKSYQVLRPTLPSPLCSLL